MSNKIKRKGTPSSAPKRSKAANPETGSKTSPVTWALRIGGVVVAVALIAFFLGTDDGQRANPPSGVETFDDVERGHVTGVVEYAMTPPAGGEHNPVWANCGFYSTAIPTENILHSMEHGAVWISYRADLIDDGQLDRIRDLAKKTDVIATPLDEQAEPVVATAWGVQLRLESADDDRLDEFVSAYRRGPQTPEPAGACTGGIGTPDA